MRKIKTFKSFTATVYAVGSSEVLHKLTGEVESVALGSLLNFVRNLLT